MHSDIMGSGVLGIESGSGACRASTLPAVLTLPPLPQRILQRWRNTPQRMLAHAITCSHMQEVSLWQCPLWQVVCPDMLHVTEG